MKRTAMIFRAMCLLLAALLCVSLPACKSEQDKFYDELVSGQEESMPASQAQSAGVSQAGEGKKLSGELRIAMPIRDEGIRRMSKSFMELHPDVKITFDCIVDDVGNGIPDDCENRYVQKTVTELSGGDAADIVDLAYVSFYKYAKTGLFEDLNELMANDPEINRDDLYTNILDAFEDAEGKLYALPPVFRFSVFLLNDYIMYEMDMDAEKEFEDGMSYQDLIDLYWKAVEDGVIKSGAERGGCYFAADQNKNYFDGYAFPMFLDEKNGEARFDTPEFIEYLKMTDTLPFQRTVKQGGTYPFNWPTFGPDDYFCQQLPAIPAHLGEIDHKTLAGSTGALFYKDRDGNIPFTASTLLAIPKGENAELAWEFLKFAIAEKDFPEKIDIYDPVAYNESFLPYSQGVPINRKNYQKLYSAAFSPALMEKFDAYQQTLNIWGASSYELMANLMDILISYYDNHLISAEECAKQLQERAWIYMNE